MEEKIKLKKVISRLREDFRPSEDLIYNKTTKGATIMYPKDKKASMRPKWFRDWYKEFKEYNDKRWDEQNKRWDQQNKRWEEQNKRWEKQEAFNSQVFEFMQRQDEFNKVIMQRLDNIVTKNHLSE